MAAQRLRHLVERGAGFVEELDQGLGAPAERAVVDDRGESLQGSLRPQPVDAPLHRRRRELHPLADVLVGAPPVLHQQRKNSSIYGVHMLNYCALTPWNRH
jgi:hypothetical protein